MLYVCRPELQPAQSLAYREMWHLTQGCKTRSPSQWVHCHSPPCFQPPFVSSSQTAWKAGLSPKATGSHLSRYGGVVEKKAPEIGSHQSWYWLHDLRAQVTSGTHLHLGNEEPQPLQWRLVRGSNELTQAQSSVPEARGLVPRCEHHPIPVGQPWVSHATLQSLSFLSCKMGTWMVGCVWIKHGALCEATLWTRKYRAK